MDCDGLRRVLFDHLDGLLGRAEAEAARAHLAACGPCSALQEEVRRNFAALDAWEDEDLPEGALERLRARLPAGPRPRVEIAAAIGAAPGAPRAPSSPSRRWLRLAVPYAAGLATAAVATLAVVLPRASAPRPSLPAPSGYGPSVPAGGPAAGSPLPSPGPFAPAAGGAGGAMPASATADAAVPAAPASATPLRAGERKLEFRDVDNGVMRKVWLPGNMDPEKVMLVDTPERVLPDDRGVR